MANNRIFARYHSHIRRVISANKKAPELLKKWNQWDNDNPNRKVFPYTVWETTVRSCEITKSILDRTEDKVYKRHNKQVYTRL